MAKRHPAAPPLRLVTEPIPLAAVHVTPPPLPHPGAWPGPGGKLPAPSGQTVRRTLELSTGRRLVIEGPGIIGRNPGQDGTYAHLIKIDDPGKQLSRNHFAFGLTETGLLWVEDLGSRNGTYLMTGRLQQGLEPGQRIPLGDNAVIRFGQFTAAFHTSRS